MCKKKGGWKLANVEDFIPLTGSDLDDVNNLTVTSTT